MGLTCSSFGSCASISFWRCTQSFTYSVANKSPDVSTPSCAARGVSFSFPSALIIAEAAVTMLSRCPCGMRCWSVLIMFGEVKVNLVVAIEGGAASTSGSYLHARTGEARQRVKCGKPVRGHGAWV